MAVVVIGGQASGVGKTSVVCALIAAMPERRWTAIKITQCSHQDGERACDCELHGQSVAITGHISSGRWPVTSYDGEQNRMARADSYRYLAAGAVQSKWVRTLPGHLGKVIPRIEQEIKRGGNVVIESNSVMEFLRPDIYALIVSRGLADFKPSARRYVERADAILTVKEPHSDDAWWPDTVEMRMSQVPVFSVDAARHVSPGFFAFVRRRLSGIC